MLLNRVRSKLLNRPFRGKSTWPNLRHLNVSPYNVTSNLPSVDDNLARRKINELVAWYEEVTGMDEVRLCQNRVIEAQDKFVAAQENRRKLASELNLMQNKLKEIHSELNSTTRGEERYLQLITEEYKILKDERRLNSEFALSERDERDSFNLLSSRLKESHEKERAQANRTKYWSIIASLVSVTLGIVGTSINNSIRMRELRKLVGDSKSSSLNTNELSTLLADVRESIRQTSENVVHQISSRGSNQQELMTYISGLGQELQELKRTLNSDWKTDGHVVFLSADSFDKQKKEIRNIAIGVSLLAVVSGIIIVLFQK